MLASHAPERWLLMDRNIQPGPKEVIRNIREFTALLSAATDADHVEALTGRLNRELHRAVRSCLSAAMTTRP
jgi:hypothetical protein